MSDAPAVRPATAEDLIFIRSSWKTDFWKVHARKSMSHKVYAQGQSARIARLLLRSTALVAYFPQVPDEVLGWAVFEGDVLHYVYVKSSYRRVGIASGLAGDRARWYSHPTNEAGRCFMRSIGAQFNPYAAE